MKTGKWLRLFVLLIVVFMCTAPVSEEIKTLYRMHKILRNFVPEAGIIGLDIRFNPLRAFTVLFYNNTLKLVTYLPTQEAEQILDLTKGIWKDLPLQLVGVSLTIAVVVLISFSSRNNKEKFDLLKHFLTPCFLP